MVIINANSGNSRHFTDEELSVIIGRDYAFTRIDIDDDYLSAAKATDCSAIVIVGGDGTLNSILNKLKNLSLTVYYIPKGTLNEKAKTFKRFNSGDNYIIGKANGKIFTYVAACGTFTPIGYLTKTKTKKRLKLFAYFFRTLKEYKVNDIQAKIDVDGVNYDGHYTLIMFLKSPRCFIFRFNRLFSPTSDYGHLLLIKSPGKNNLRNKIKIFFPLFRAFFIGFNKTMDKKNLKFLQFNKVQMTLPSKTPFAFDGEKRFINGDVTFTMEPLKANLVVCDPKKIK